MIPVSSHWAGQVVSWALTVLAALGLAYAAVLVVVVLVAVGLFVYDRVFPRGRAEVRAAVEAATAKAVPDLVPAQREGEK